MTTDVDHSAVRHHLEQQFMATAERLPRVMDLVENELRLMSDFERAYEQDPPDEEALARIAAEFEGNESLVVRKLEAYIGLDAKFSMIADGFKARAAQLRELAAISERNRERLRARLLTAMQTMGRDKVVTPAGIVSVRANPGRVDVLEEALVPKEFLKTVVTTTVDKRALGAELKAGVVVPGAVLVKTDRLEIQ